MKRLADMTTGEAEAWRQGYEVGFAAGMKTNSDITLKPIPGLGFPPCRSKNPSVMCPKCNCWKMFREYCS